MESFPFSFWTEGTNLSLLPLCSLCLSHRDTQVSGQWGPGALWSLSPAPAQAISVPSAHRGCSGMGQLCADTACGDAEQVLMAAQRPTAGPTGCLRDTELSGRTVSGGWVLPSSLPGFP